MSLGFKRLNNEIQRLTDLHVESYPHQIPASHAG